MVDSRSEGWSLLRKIRVDLELNNSSYNVVVVTEIY